VTPAVTTPATRAIDRLPALDGIRIIAATAVIGVHVRLALGDRVFGYWGGLFEELSVGVAIFFVLSGFVVFQPWVRAAAAGAPAPDPAAFLVRRFARIVPACWIVIAVCLIVLGSDITKSDWLRNLSFTQIYTGNKPNPGLGQTWTLCVELTFYLILPALAAAVLLRRAPGRPWHAARSAAWIAAIMGSVTVCWLTLLATGVLHVAVYDQWLPAYMMWFGAGMILSTAYVALREGSAPRAWRLLQHLGTHPWLCWAAAAALFALGATGVAAPRSPFADYSPAQFSVRLFLHLGIAVLVVIPLAFGPQTRLRSAIAARPMRWLGGSLSYGVYLWHPFALAMVYRVTGWPELHGHLKSVFGLTLLSTLVLATVSYYVVERPAIRLASRFRAVRHGAHEADGVDRHHGAPRQPAREPLDVAASSPADA
jgi:peptidoglycan/LPS O-acetylase OafA/YrhL